MHSIQYLSIANINFMSNINNHPTAEWTNENDQHQLYTLCMHILYVSK